MFKSLGLGICCLTLSISGVTRASILPIDGGKYGDNKCVKIEDKGCKFDITDILKGLDLKNLDLGKLDLGKLNLCDIRDNKDCRDIKPVDCNKDHKEVCKVDWKINLPPILCDIFKNHDKDRCEVIDRCDFHVDCDHHEHSCDPAAVPAPSAAAFGGLGVAGMMLVTALRRRSVA
jgi:hypothetical protein